MYLLQVELPEITGALNFRVNMQIPETVQRWPGRSAKCSAVWVLPLVSVGAMALV